MKRIEDIDKNFAPENIYGHDIIFYDAKNSVFSISGLYLPHEKNSVFRRLPPLSGVCDGVNTLALNTAGGKIRFRTNSSCIAIRAEIESACLMSHMTLAGSCGFDIYTFDGHEERFFRAMMPSTGICYGEKSFQCFLNLYDNSNKELALYFPLYNGIKKLEIGLDTKATVDKGASFLLDSPIVYYGSSITQGGCASRPGNAYPALITHKLNIDHINLGFSGSAVGEIEMADYIATLDMCAFVYDYDYNAPTPEYLRKTHEPFFKRIRRAKPSLPIVMLSAPYNAKDGDDRTRRDIIKSTYDHAVTEGDTNVYFIDGGSIFEGAFPDACTVDGVHPNDLGFSRMAEKIIPVLEKALNL